MVEVNAYFVRVFVYGNAIVRVVSCEAALDSSQTSQVPCYSPITATRSLHQGPNGKFSIQFSAGDGVPIQLPCGQCIGCRLEYSRQWAVRCMHEASLHDYNCFITLTYRDENLPDYGSLNKRDSQLFFKRLRKRTGRRIRYYHCGEYGDQTQRPHYHACIFGYDFDDKIPHSTNHNGDTVYTSSMLDDIWGLGNCMIGALTFESAAYVARYVTKKITGARAQSHYERYDPETGEIINLLPEYVTMSRRPGIGKGWYEKYQTDLYPADEVIVRGKQCKVPKYYDGLYEIDDPEQFAQIKQQRQQEAQKWSHDNTSDRLLVKKTVKKAKIKTLRRKL